MDKADRWGDIATSAMGTFSERFKASDNAKNYILMLTRVKSLGDNGIGLVRVNKLTGKVEGKVVIDAAAGEEFSLILCKDPANNDVQEVYACGNNLRGQLGINRMSHV